MSVAQPVLNNPLIARFKTFYQNLKYLPLDEIDMLYHPDVVFKDPVHEIRGINDLHAYMTTMCGNVVAGRFEYLDQLVAEDSAYIKWNMYFAHSRLGTDTIVVRGISQIQFGDYIYFHEDVYDMGQMLYEHLPVLGATTRWLKHRLIH